MTEILCNIQVLVVVYVTVIVWLVYNQFRSLSLSRTEEEDLLLVVRDTKGNTKLVSTQKIMENKDSVNV